MAMVSSFEAAETPAKTKDKAPIKRSFRGRGDLFDQGFLRRSELELEVFGEREKGGRGVRGVCQGDFKQQKSPESQQPVIVPFVIRPNDVTLSMAEYSLNEFPRQQFDLSMSPGDIKALTNFFKDKSISSALEVGSWKGISSAIIARHVDVLYCVDTWLGNESLQSMREQAEASSIYKCFHTNMIQKKVNSKILHAHMNSNEAVKLFKNNTFDMIFLDADHAYSSIKQDIELWMPKVKSGGYLCGHDLEAIMTSLTSEIRELVNTQCEQDFLNNILGPGLGLHPGVTKVIFELFQDKVEKLHNSSIWVKKIEL